MSKLEEYLNIYLDMGVHCEVCVASKIVSSQTAAQNRGLRVKGYQFKKVGNNYGWNTFCEVCDRSTVHRQLLSAVPEASKERITLSKALRDKVIKLHNNLDARYGCSSTESLEVDHRVPRLRETTDETSYNKHTDEQLLEAFMLLTRQNNLTKSRACESCVRTNERGWDQLKWWYEGTEKYEGSCVGCFWHNPATWKEKATNELYRVKT
jgi:hypothetical protein